MELKKKTRAVLLAAGQGKRMKSALPKILHPVLGKSVLTRVLDAVDGLGLEHVHIIVGHSADQVIDFLKQNPPKTPWSTHLQEPQLGTGHALMQLAPELKAFDGTLLVTVADVPLLQSSTLADLVQVHDRTDAVLSLLTTKVDDPRSYGRIIRDESGQVLRIVEDKDADEAQKKITEINPAIYCFKWPAVEPGLKSLKNNNKQAEYYLTDLVEWSSSAGFKLASALTKDWREVSGINSRLELAEANKLLRDRTITNLALESGVTIIDPASTWIAPEVKIGQDSTIFPGCYITGEVQIGASCLIGPNSQISGLTQIGNHSQVAHSVVVACQIGSAVTIGPFAHLREQAVIADKCRIGNFVEIKKSQVKSQTNVSHLSYIGDAVLGEQVNIGAGTITANYDRLSGKKSQTVIGDNSSTGSNSVLVAPVTIGNEAMVAAGTVVTRDVPDGALALGRARQENREGWISRRLAKK
ncbi:MAG: bifunctional UDP-N-acetylglucosamine diphosphorylase/glucosamine-1-phosphate N-acetyltransferase GlmU [Candidatus Obscuribacterales bacterium]|nr:bifunctional UDP-N-acetylglucosamine diphosphorylase/glucosamine-1-phosphate N-acetyltransferase GlmU [Candidatus Obscuribacterales bacterium]